MPTEILKETTCTTPYEHLADHSCVVRGNERIGNDLYVLTFETTQLQGFSCVPGQFVMIDLMSERFFFRRPMSVLDVVDDRTFRIVYKVHGQGTGMMAEWQTGKTVRMLGPLGNRFTEVTTPLETLLVGGGIGIAPLFSLAKETVHAGKKAPTIIYGARSQDDLGEPLVNELKNLVGDNLILATDDGSAGVKGTVIDAINETLLEKAFSQVQICGPTPMMKAMVTFAQNRWPKSLVETSLEERMPCGTGACTGCVVFRCDQSLPSKTCLEGPVFDASVLQWKTL